VHLLVTGTWTWAKSVRSIISEPLLFHRQHPFNTLHKLPADPKQDLRPNLHAAAFQRITGIADVAQIVFVRKQLVEIQYFRTLISDEQREEFGQLVQDSIRRIEGSEFLPHSGIRFPQNPCTCSHIGLCLGRPDLTEAALVRRPGADDLGWFDELTY
jgi:hypothetical protein